ncbi:MAG: hypothetical protein GF317_08070 [Candidatus Lokiarchaeota archaeon]|nr:hypothetical protein [Candidatus Lokiarchaeota archaeon]MBD3199669.1 hypothetical protein [Candidatus Lokiarchaeota archaeon]
MDIYAKILEICLDQSFDFFSSLPCSYNIDLIQKLENLDGIYKCESGNTLKHVPLVREESGVVLNAGAALTGRKTAMILQNQGLGNMLGQMLSFNSQMEGSYKIPNLYIISHRGSSGEKISAQKPMGKISSDILDLVDIKYKIIESLSDLDNIAELFEEFKNAISIALLVKPDYEDPPERIHSIQDPIRKFSSYKFQGYEIQPTLKRFDVLKTIMKVIKEEFMLTNIGHPSRELYNIRDRPQNFYLTSSLGQCYMLGLGVVLGLEKTEIKQKVICTDGDGAILMNASSLSIVAHQAPENLIIIILDNGVYGSTGNTDTYASKNVNISDLALAYGFSSSKIFTISTDKELVEKLNYSLRNKGPFFLHVIITDDFEKVPTIQISNIEIKERFVNSINERKHNQNVSNK